MRSIRHCTLAVIGVVVGVVGSGFLTAVSAHADPLPTFCQPTSVVDGVCTARLATVTADAVDGTITGTPVGGGTPVTLAGPGDAYLTSAGFGDAAPEPVRRWDTTITDVNALGTDSSDPNWYGNAKAKVFLSRTLNGLATEFPPDSLLVRFTADGAQPGSFRIVSIQPIAQ